MRARSFPASTGGRRGPRTARCGAHLVGVHVQAPIRIPAFAGGPVPTFDLYEAYEAAAKAEHDTAAATFDEAIKGHAPAQRMAPRQGLPEEELVVQARYADLLVLGQAEQDNETLTPGALPGDGGDIVRPCGAGRPACRCSSQARQVNHAVLERQPWKMARAAAEALPFLVSAEKVIVLIVDTRKFGSGHGPDPGDERCGLAGPTWRQRHRPA